MRKSSNYQVSISLIVLLIGVLLSCTIFASANVVTTHALSDEVSITYIYQNEVITNFPVKRGEGIRKTFDCNNYKDELNLPPNCILQWHIGEENGELWSIDYIFNEDTILYGEIILYSDQNDNDDPIDDDPIDNPDGNPENENGGNSGEISGGSDGGSDGSVSGSDGKTNDDENANETIKSGHEEVDTVIYDIAVISDNDNFVVTGKPKKGEKITITFKEYSEGFGIKIITVFCDNVPVVFTQKGSGISFYMPEGDVSVECIYDESKQKKGILTSQEIIALSVVASVAVACGGYFIIKSKLSKKNTPKSKKKIT